MIPSLNIVAWGATVPWAELRQVQITKPFVVDLADGPIRDNPRGEDWS